MPNIESRYHLIAYFDDRAPELYRTFRLKRDAVEAGKRFKRIRPHIRFCIYDSMGKIKKDIPLPAQL